MRPADRNRWKNEALDAVFEALVSSSDLSEVLIFKGARVLGLLLNSCQRQSLDIDANRVEGQPPGATREEQAAWLETAIGEALTCFFEDSSPQRYELSKVDVMCRPQQGVHRQGWDAFLVKVVLIDLRREGQKGLPFLTIDIAAPETLLGDSLTECRIGRGVAKIYTLKKIVGEKLRAFLSSLPAYATKLAMRPKSVRVKDLYDVARVERLHSLSDEAFWRAVGAEFRASSTSRFVDCDGLSAFAENFDVTRESYLKDATIPDDISFDDAWGVLERIVIFFESEAIIPFATALDEFPVQ